jgi:hypothetical protein
MATNHGKNRGITNKKTLITQPKKNKPVKKDLLDSLSDYFINRQKIIFFFGLALTLLFSILLFDVKVSPGGDDSAYITRAYDVVHGFTFPVFQGPLYPFVLSFFVWIFGINLIVLKCFSLLCVVFSVYLFYKTFADKMPPVIVGVTFILLSFNYSLLYYSSQTYSEAFYLLLQSILFWVMAKKFTGEDSEKRSLKDYFIVGLLVFLLTLTRNVALGALLAVIGYFVVTRKWKSLLMSFGSFTVCYVLFGVFKRIIWGDTGLQIASQASSIGYKSFYNPSMGNEDFMGFVQRFIDNSNMFFSKHIFNFLGLRLDAPGTSIILMLLIWIVLGIALFLGLRKNKLLLLTAIYTIAMCAVSFIALQKDWSQSRMIIVYLPFFLIMFFAVLFHWFKTDRFKRFQFLVPVTAVLLIYTSFNFTASNVKQQNVTLSHNLDGDLLYGLTPDWVNYILMSKWAAANVPKNAGVAVRKQDISFIYGQRKFIGITKVPTITPDSLLKLIPQPMTYVGIEMDKLIQSPVYNDSLRAKIVAFVNGDLKLASDSAPKPALIGVFRFRTGEFAEWEQIINKSGIKYEKNLIPWIKNLKNTSKKFAISIPDQLLEQLKKADIRYLLLASLRTNPSQKTASIIDTLQRFVYFIQLKYPDMFKLIHQIGAQDEEPAQLIQLIY